MTARKQRLHKDCNEVFRWIVNIINFINNYDSNVALIDSICPIHERSVRKLTISPAIVSEPSFAKVVLV